MPARIIEGARQNLGKTLALERREVGKYLEAAARTYGSNIFLSDKRITDAATELFRMGVRGTDTRYQITLDDFLGMIYTVKDVPGGIEALTSERMISKIGSMALKEGVLGEIAKHLDVRYAKGYPKHGIIAGVLLGLAMGEYFSEPYDGRFAGTIINNGEGLGPEDTLRK